jgi:oxygen-dependent protoporphyrinogen oxidase
VSLPDVEVAVVGAGVAGLAAGVALRAAGREVVVLEAGARAGGAASSERIDGHLVERGPNTFRVPAATDAFLRAHGLDALLVEAAPAARARFLLRGAALVPVPMGPLALARTPLLSVAGKLRLLAEPFVRRGDGRGESVAEFATRRFGREALEALVGPFLTGVYAGDERRLGAEAVFPALVAAEQRAGSVVRGLVARALRARGAPRGRRGTWSAAEGVAALTDALAGRLGPALGLRNRVSEVRPEAGGLRLELEGPCGGTTLRARRLLVATPAPEAAALLAGVEAEAAKALASVEYAPVASVSLSIARGSTRVPVRGFGYLVPRGEGDALLGCLFPGQLFPGRAPAGRELLTLLAGGVRRPEAVRSWSDERLVASLVGELERALGLREAPRVLAVTRWPRAVPQPGREHRRLVADARRRLAGAGRIALAGAAWDGVAFGDALASGAAAAQWLKEGG